MNEVVDDLDKRIRKLQSVILLLTDIDCDFLVKTDLNNISKKLIKQLKQEIAVMKKIKKEIKII